MRYSKFIGRSLREVPKEAEAVSYRLLLKAGYVDPLIAGVFTLLPLGWRVMHKIEEVIREEMEGIGGQEILMPALQKKEQWLESTLQGGAIGRVERRWLLQPPKCVCHAARISFSCSRTSLSAAVSRAGLNP